jgi:hypothetical protein
MPTTTGQLAGRSAPSLTTCHGRAGVLDDTLADGAEQQPGEPAHTTSTDHDEVGSLTRLQQGAPRVVADDPLGDGSRRCDAGDRHAEGRPGCSLPVVRVERLLPIRVVLVQVAPRHHRQHRRVMPTRLVDGPAERGVGLWRAVDADHDQAHRDHLRLVSEVGCGQPQRRSDGRSTVMVTLRVDVSLRPIVRAGSASSVGALVPRSCDGCPRALDPGTFDPGA